MRKCSGLESALKQITTHRVSFSTNDKLNQKLGQGMDKPSRWCHQVKTFSALLAFCAGISPVSGEFPTQRPVTRSFDVILDLCLNNGWVNNREAGDLRRHRTHYDVVGMYYLFKSRRCNYSYPNDGLTKQQLKSGHGWVIISHAKQWICLFIHVLICVNICWYKTCSVDLVLDQRHQNQKVGRPLCHATFSPDRQ